MRAALLFVVLMSSWLLMSGHYTVLIISLGVVSVVFCVWLSHAINAIDDEGLPTHIFARLPAGNRAKICVGNPSSSMAFMAWLSQTQNTTLTTPKEMISTV